MSRGGSSARKRTAIFPLRFVTPRTRNLFCICSNASCSTSASNTFPSIRSHNASTVSFARISPSFNKMTSLAICSISETTCVAKITIFPIAISEITFRMRIRSLGSNPAVGSSKINTFGSFIIACATRRRCFIPPEKAPIF